MKKKNVQVVRRDRTIAVTEYAFNELDLIRKALRKTKRWCLEDIIHEKFVEMSSKNFFNQRCS